MLRVDIVSDVVCPWCYVGYKQLALAAKDSGIDIDFHWYPFELNPSMAPEGELLNEHLSRKYGTTAADNITTQQKLQTLGETLEIDFQFASDMSIVNTFLAHQLLYWAGTHGKQHALKLRLFADYFTNSKRIDDIETLCDAAASVGLDAKQAHALLQSQDYADSVREQQRYAISKGISAVPAMIFEQRNMEVGAQGVPRYSEILTTMASQ